MIKNVLRISLLAVLGIGIATVGQINNNVKAVKAEEETVDIYGEHNYFTGEGGTWGKNSLTTEEEGKIKFLRLTNENGADNGYLLMDKEVKHGGTYLFSGLFRADANFKSSNNIGFGFWAGEGRIKDTVISSYLVADEWKKVEIKFEFTETEATNIDSIHMWILEDGGHIDIQNLSLVTVSQGKLENNIFKDVGFENVDLSKGDRTGWNDRHSGVIGCRPSQVLWTSEGEGDDYNQFLRLNYNNGDDVQFADFCSFFNDWDGSWPAGIAAGEYLVEMDIRTNDLFDTDNVGFAFYSKNGTRIERDLTPQVKAAKVNEWTHITYRYPDTGVELTQNYADGVDTIQVWANSLNIKGWALDIDNVSVRKISLVEDERPEFKDGEYAFQWVEANKEDVVIQISDLHGHDEIEVLNGNYTLIAGDEYTYNNDTKVLTISSDFLAEFDDGIETFTIKTEGGERQFTIEITHIQEDLPNVNNYELEETVFGGDFSDLDVGYVMKTDQTSNAWGAVSLDDGGKIIEEADGSHALQLKKPQGSTKFYSSTFVIFHPEKIVENTIVTFAFDYKYNGETTDGSVDVSWVGSSNKSFHLIPLNGSKAEKTAEPDAKYRQWDITYTALDNGYTHVVTSMRIDAATVTSTNSIRFLMKYSGSETQELRIQNVSLKRWVKSIGSLDIASAAFNKSNPQDIVVNATFDDGLEFYALALDNKTSYVNEKNFTVIPANNNEYKITIKKEYLATLTNGNHTFYVSSTENSDNEYAELPLLVTVSGESGGTSETGNSESGNSETSSEGTTPSKKRGCGGSIIAASSILSILSIAGVSIVISKKRKNK